MKERPILFSGPMVRAILEGRKTQTRRVVKPEPHSVTYLPGRPPLINNGPRCPYGQPGDRLWVRETWKPHYTHTPTESGDHYETLDVSYRAGGDRREINLDTIPDNASSGLFGGKTWKPSIHMPRWASRLTLEVTGVRVERLQEISEEDAKAEGVWTDEASKHLINWPSLEFRKLWNSLAKPGTDWSANPWVWVIEFRRLP